MDDNYQLYVGRLQALPEGIRFSFYNDRHCYFLVYDSKKPEGDFCEVDDVGIEALSDEELQWLFLCKAAINAEHMAKHGEQYADMLSDYADELEYQFKVEMEKIKREAED